VGASACSSTEPPPVVHYGAPIPVDAGNGELDSGGTGGAAGSDAATGTGGAPSNDAAEDRSAVPLYGAPAPINSDGGG
jgi:hypothetical protein